MLGAHHYKIGNSKKAISNFYDKHITGYKVILCVLESTGGYENKAMSILQKYGIPVHRVHPNRVYTFAKAKGHFAKTDKLDSILLESYAKFVAEVEKGDAVMHKQGQNLRELRSMEHNLEDHLHGNQCRLEHATGKTKIYLQEQIDFVIEQLAKIRKDIEQIINEDTDLKTKSDLLTSYKVLLRRQLVYY